MTTTFEKDQEYRRIVEATTGTVFSGDNALDCALSAMEARNG